MNLARATADALLGTPIHQLWASLGDTPEAVQRTWRHLAQRWHPDRSGETEASAVFAHLAQARRTWRPTAELNCVDLPTRAGTRLILHYQHAFTHELGHTYVGHGHVLDHYPEDQADLSRRAWSTLSQLPFATPAMRDQMGPCLPAQATLHPLVDGGSVVVSTKDRHFIRLADVMARIGPVDPLHVAWIGSGLWNMACYLQAVGWTHQAIHADTVWVDPVGHRVALLGGWAYAGRVGDPWVALPAASLSLAPLALRSKRHHATQLDHLLIRSLLSRLLAAASSAPAAMTLNARLPAGGSAVEQYRAWKQAVEASFGPPAFVRWNLSPLTFYQEN